MSRKKQLIEARAKLIKDAQAVADDKDFDNEKQTQFNKMMDEAAQLQTQIDAIAKADEAAAKLEDPVEFNAGQENVDSQESKTTEFKAQYDKAFDSYLRGGIHSLSSEEKQVLHNGKKLLHPQAAQEIATDTKGGHTVPEGFMDQVEVALAHYNALRQSGASVLRTSTGQTIPYPTLNGTAVKGRRVAEGAASQTTDMTFGAVNLEAFTYTSDVILVSNELLQDTAVDLVALIADQAGERIGRITNEEFTDADGSSKPQGVVTGAADSSITAAAVAAVTFEELVDLKFSVDKAYRDNPAAGFMFTDATLKFIAKMKDGENRPLLLPSIRDGEPDTVLGKRYTINPDMDEMAATNKALLFGDFSKYMIRDVAGGVLRRLDERYADQNQTAFILFTRHDGKMINAGTGPVKFLTMAAS